MLTICLIHTVPTIYSAFPKMLEQALSQCRIYNLVDEFIAADAEANGFFSQANEQRLFSLLSCACNTQADVIVVTCSTLSPSVRAMRKFFTTPIVVIDENMCVKATNSCSNLLVVSTAQSTVGPTCAALCEAAHEQGRIVHIQTLVVSPAYDAIKHCDFQAHDDLVCSAIAKVHGDYDGVILAQASMGHLQDQVEQMCGQPVFSSPQLCIDQIVHLCRERGDMNVYN